MATRMDKNMEMIIIIDAATGEIVERELTAEELAQREADLAAAEAAAAQAQAIAEQNAQAQAAAIAHAKSLGFTDEMIAVMYPNLGGQ